jgi:hypothetical protein
VLASCFLGARLAGVCVASMVVVNSEQQHRGATGQDRFNRSTRHAQYEGRSRPGCGSSTTFSAGS